MAASNPSPAQITASAPGWADKGVRAMQRSHLLGAGLLTLLLAGCQLSKPRVEGPPAFSAANPVTGAVSPAVQPTAPQPVSATRAVALLDAVCGASLPNFGTIDAALRANGITVVTTANTQRSASEHISFRLADGPGDGKTCAMIFGSTDPHDTTRAAFATLGAFKDTPLGLATKYRGRAAIFIYDGPTDQIGGIQFYTVRLLSER